MVSYGLMKDAHLGSYEVESVDGTDPTTDRLRWPGHILNLGTPIVEDYQHQEFNPVGNQSRSPFFVTKKGESFEFEIESLISEPFVNYGTSELWSKVFGTVNGTTGAVTISEPLPTFTFEYGWDDGSGPSFWVLSGCKIATVTLSARPGDLMVMRTKVMGRVFDGDNTAPVVCSGVSMDDLQTQQFIAHGTVTSGPFVVAETITGGTSSATGVVLSVGSNFLEYTITAGAMVSGEVLTGGTSGATATSSGAPIPAHRKPPVHFKDITFTWNQGDGTAFTNTPVVQEFDWTVENNLEELRSDNQQLFPTCLIEGQQRVTWTTKFVYEDIEKLTIFRTEPSNEAGQIKMQFVIDHSFIMSGETVQGFYMDVDAGISNGPVHSVLAEHENNHSQDTTFLQEQYSGMVVGEPTIDMAP